MSDQDPSVLYSSVDGVAELRFNRPRRLNVLDVELATGLAQAVDRAMADDTVRVIVLTAEGRGFMAGGDLASIRASEDRSAAVTGLIDIVHPALTKLAEGPKVAIAALKGPVAGGGWGVALSVDLAIAAEDTVFNFAYAKIAGSPDCGSSWALPRLVGTRKALEIALLSENVDAHEAQRLGLVNRVVPVDRLEEETMAVARRLAASGPIGLASIKRMIRTSHDRDYTGQLDAERSAFAATAASADFAEGIDAFLSRRQPSFTGR
jgi:2-(1,2-epoxy-1,2-dihydrophenyl)acetyl-CoA isomerase